MKLKRSENTGIAPEAGENLLTFVKPKVMGIVNLTPDSFYDGGRYASLSSVLRDTAEKIELGAEFLDLGAASSRPGAAEVSEEEEWQRLEPALRAIRKEFPDVLISVDTFRSSIAQKSADAGANLINDISGGNADPNMFATVARLQLPYVLMHMQGNPQTMQSDPQYSDVVDDVLSFFCKQIAELDKLGFKKIILDPGFGFGKNTEHNFQLLKHIGKFTNLGFPVMVGLSRKSMINKVIGTNPVTALNGTTVLHTMALLNGASLLRVHDVKEAKQAIDLFSYYRNL